VRGHHFGGFGSLQVSISDGDLRGSVPIVDPMPTVYITAPRDAARELASFLVEERLAACVNVVDCESFYRWDGTVHEGDDESILLAKTTAERYGDLKTRLEAVHPNDVPCIERFDEADVLDSFAGWIDEEVREPSPENSETT
jgi:periplasmic divalent cation tolerance protein